MTTGITKVRNSIIKWRREQGKLRDVPIELRSEAVQLLESHSWSEVSEQLGISKATLSGWRKSARGQSITPHVPQAITGAGAFTVCSPRTNEKILPRGVGTSKDKSKSTAQWSTTEPQRLKTSVVAPGGETFFVFIEPSDR